MVVTFGWDPFKDESNQRKHGVAFIEAISAFRDPLSLTVGDPDHSVSEKRLLLLGRTSDGKLLVIAHTETGGHIRIINARPATRRERKTYEEG